MLRKTNKNFANEAPRRLLNDFCLRDVQCRAQIMGEGIHDRLAPHKVSMKKQTKSVRWRRFLYPRSA